MSDKLCCIVVLCIACLFAATSVSSGADVGDEIMKKCSAEWPGDYAMQKYCRDQQIDGAIKLKEYLDAYPEGNEEYNMIVRCYGEWPGDYNMIIYCFEKQLEAYRELYQ